MSPVAPWLEAVWATLAARRSADRMPHALLLGGPAGLGKRDFARALGRALLCERPAADGHACGRCRACALFDAGTHPDWRFVSFEPNDEGKLRSEIIVDQIRCLGAALAGTSLRGGYRVAVIDPATAMNEHAANALLKTLEEPESGAVLVLVADTPSRLLPTLRSRCQRVEFRPPSAREAEQWVARQGVAPSDAALLLDLAAGNPGLALALAAPVERERIRAVAADLAALLAARANAAAIASRWAQDEDRGRQRVLLAALLSRSVAVRPEAPVAVTFRDLARLTVPIDWSTLALWWERANRVREQLRTPLRADLLLTDLLYGLARAADEARPARA